MIRRLCTVFFAIATITLTQALPAGAPAQPPQPGNVIAAVKSVASGAKVAFAFQPRPGGGLHAEGVPISDLISNALGIRPDQIQGLPDWAGTRFSLDAELASDAPNNAGNAPAMMAASLLTLQTVLAQRFGLHYHWSEKTVNGYVLRVYKGHPKLPNAPADEVAFARTHVAPSVKAGRGFIIGSPITTKTLARMLATFLGVNVVDSTSLAGQYDVVLKWTAQENRVAGDTSPDLFTALRDQLGLVLESAKVAMPIVIIDKISLPTPN